MPERKRCDDDGKDALVRIEEKSVFHSDFWTGGEWRCSVLKLQVQQPRSGASSEMLRQPQPAERDRSKLG